MTRAHISKQLRDFVNQRAQGCCEYCLLNQTDADSPHQVDHLMPLKHSGQTVSENLALACQLCNRYKGSDLGAIDPASVRLVALFNPRVDNWTDHFELDGARIVGLTLAGRATVAVLRLNQEARLLDRITLIEAGRYPPSIKQ